MRRLAIAALSFSAAVFLACYALPLSALFWAALLFAALGLVLRQRRERWLHGFVLAAFSVAVGFGWFLLYAHFTVKAAEALVGETLPVRAVVVSWPQNYESYTRLDVRLETEGLTVMLYDNDKLLSDSEPGETIELNIRFRAADTLYGERYHGYHARGVFLIGTAKGEIVRTPGGFSLALLPLRINHAIGEMVDAVFPADTAAFYRALMLGDKTELYQQSGLYLAFCRAGLAHVMAVSGMHIVFLVTLLQSVLGRTRRSSLLCMGLVWLFVCITGAGPSAVRAGFMQTLMLLAPLVRRENDPATSLSAALGLILLVNPYAAASVSLQLSFASLTGIYLFAARLSEPIYEALPVLRESYLGKTAVGAVVNSLSTLPVTLPLVALHFGSVSILSPLSNLLCMSVVELCFCGAYLLCALGFVFLPAAVLFGKLLAFPARYLIAVARLISRIPIASVYLSEKGTLLWLVLVYLLFIGFRFVKARGWVKLAVPATLSLSLLLGMLTYAALDYRRGQPAIAALDVGQGQCLSVICKDSTVVIDCGGLGTSDDAGETAGAYLLSRGRTSLDAVVLTHLDRDHCNGLASLLELCRTKRLYLPKAEEDDSAMLAEVIAACENRGTERITLEHDTEIALDGLKLRLFAPMEGTSGNDYGIAAAVSLGDYDMLVTGDYSQKTECALLKAHPLRDMELYIVGHHGSKYASSEQLLESIGADTAIVSCGYNTYGHPTAQVLERLAAYGYTVHRTDEEGTVELRIGG